MIEQLIDIDQAVFRIINHSFNGYVFDTFLSLIRNKFIWGPLYLFLILFLITNFKRLGLYCVLGLLACFAVSDTLSSKIVKPSVERVRPCNDKEMKSEVRLLVPCGVGYSFTSSHATNHFAFATFISLALGALYKWIGPAFLIWAFLISYAQVYVGVHYPADVIAGGLLGAIIGYVCYFIFQRVTGIKKVR